MEHGEDPEIHHNRLSIIPLSICPEQQEESMHMQREKLSVSRPRGHGITDSVTTEYLLRSTHALFVNLAALPAR